MYLELHDNATFGFKGDLLDRPDSNNLIVNEDS